VIDLASPLKAVDDQRRAEDSVAGPKYLVWPPVMSVRHLGNDPPDAERYGRRS
jgi:hypothetical protein